MNNIIKSRKVLQVNGKKEVGKMETKIYIKDLPCYQRKGNASEKRIRVMERHFYDLGLLVAEGQKKEMEAFIRSRGEEHPPDLPEQ